MLWLAADGKCQICGKELPENWHADHITPWVVSHDTNIHEMQALCPPCNSRKGAFMWRKHQLRMQQICRDIRRGETIKRIIASVTPGGGKSLLPVILGHELIPAMFDKMCWVVPRVTLQEQAEGAFLGSQFPEIQTGHHEIRVSTNDWDPSRNKSGFTTTYQAIAADKGYSIAEEFRRFRYILVLDEPHHVEDCGPWHSAIQTAISRAGLVVFMSGTFARGDGHKIAEIDYERGADGRLVFDPKDTADTRVIRYSRVDALEERAIIPIQFVHHDGAGEFINPNGQPVLFSSFGDFEQAAGQGLFAALHTEYARSLLDECLMNWSLYRRSNPRSKMIVVAPNIQIARIYFEHLKKRGASVSIATSDDSDGANKEIRKFKRHGHGSIDILVTVAMAYEGLDVPSVTHIACLTHIRSVPWIEQMLARATRYDRHAGRWDEQKAVIHVPDDPMMRKVIETIQAEQAAFVTGWEDPRDGGSGDGSEKRPDDGDPRGDIIPIDGQLTRSRSSDLQSGEATDWDENKLLTAIIHDQGLPMTPIQAKKFLAAYMTQDPPTHDGPAPMTASQKESVLLSQIEKFCKFNDRRLGKEWGYTNGLVKRAFGKGRPGMTYDELCRVWAWLQREFPMEATG